MCHGGLLTAARERVVAGLGCSMLYQLHTLVEFHLFWLFLSAVTKSMLGLKVYPTIPSWLHILIDNISFSLELQIFVVSFYNMHTLLNLVI